MKKALSAVLTLCLILVGVLFSGCGISGIVLTGGPAYDEPIYGNGSMVVTKGDYVYFANGYVKSDALGKTVSNIQGTVENGGLYRAKLTTMAYDEGSSAVITQAFEDVQLMVSKIVGFEDCGMYIYKDKIYFASPTIAQDKTGIRYDLVTFYSCNLDGSGLTELYQTTEFGDTAEFSMTMINQNVYLLVYTGTKIIKVEENKTVTEMANDVTDVVFPARENVLNEEENPKTNECFIYYTKNTKSENTIDLGNTLYKKDIISNEETELLKQNYIKVDLISITAGRLFYTRNNENSETQSYYSNSLDSESFASSETRHTWQAVNGFVALGELGETNLGVVFVYNSKLYLRGINQGINEVTELVSATSILGAKDGYVYYVHSSNIFRVNVTSTTVKAEEVSGDLKPLTTIYDIDSTFCYFFVEDTTVVSGYSLYKIALDGLASGNSKAVKIA